MSGVEVNDLLGSGKIVETIGRGVGRVYTDYITLPKIYKQDGYQDLNVEISSDGVKVTRKGKVVDETQLSNNDKNEVMKLVLKMENLNLLITKMREELDEATIEKDVLKSIDTGTFLYLQEKYKYISNRENADTLNNLIVNKLKQRDEISKAAINLIDELSTSEIRDLQKIKKLLISYKQRSIKGNEFSFYIGEIDGNVINREKELTPFYYFPSIFGDDFLKHIDAGFKFDKILRFSSMGLYSTMSGMSRSLSNNMHPESDRTVHFLQYGDKKYFIANKYNVTLKLFNINPLGDDIFDALPETEDGPLVNYLEKLKDSQILTENLIDVTEMDEDAVLKTILSFINT